VAATTPSSTTARIRRAQAFSRRLAARASDGRANAALLEFIAARLGAAKRDVSIEAGATSRRKRVRVIGAVCAPETLLAAKAARA